MGSRQKGQAYQTVIFWLLGGLVLRTVIGMWLPAGFDEAYYYTYTLHPSLSYFDHPPLVALSTEFGIWLTGIVSPLTLRLGALLLYTGALGLLYATGQRLFSHQAGVLTLAIASLCPIFFVGFGILTLPDAPLMLFWSASLYCAGVEFFGDRGSYRPTYRLAVLGALVGLACLSKYHGVFLGLGCIGFCLTSARHRGALISPWTLLALVLFLITIVPILIWNLQHDWASLRFQASRGIPQHGYNPLEALGTVLVGMAYLFPSVGLPLWWVSVQTLWHQWVQPQTPGLRHEETRLKQQFVLWFSMPLVLGFTVIAGYQAVLPTWQMPGFWGATLLLGERATVWQVARPRCVRYWLQGTGAVMAFILLLALSHVTLGTLQKNGQYALFGGVIDPANDASTQLLDIQQLRREFAASPTLMTALQQADFIFSDRFHLCGHVAMALTPLAAKPITCLNEDLRGFAFWSTSQQWVGQSALYLAPKHQAELAIADYQPYFRAVKWLDDIVLRRGGVVVETMSVYKCNTLVKPYPRPYGKR